MLSDSMCFYAQIKVSLNSPVKRNGEKLIPVNALANLNCGHSQGADSVNTHREEGIIPFENEIKQTFPFSAFPLLPLAPAPVAAAAGETSGDLRI